MSGQLLDGRGALIPASAQARFDQRDRLRIWQGLAHGAWKVNTILARSNAQIAHERVRRALQVGGYQVKVLDTMGFFPPRLKGCATQHYQSLAGKMLPAIGIGVMGAVGGVDESMGSQTVTLLCRLVRASGAVHSEEDLMKVLATQATQQLPPHDEVRPPSASFHRSCC